MLNFKNKENKISKPCTNCFKSNNVTFNFKYIVFDDYFNDEEKKVFVDRMREVSSINYLELMSWDKYKGFEEGRVNISKDIPYKFIEEIEKFDGKYSIMRLYKNNIPTPGRIIGKLINKVFYIFYLDVKGKLYNH